MAVAIVCLGTLAHGQGIPACEDGLDNDGDGLIDFPADPGCVAPDGTSEQNTAADGAPLGDAGSLGDAGGLPGTNGDAGLPRSDGGTGVVPDGGTPNGGNDGGNAGNGGGVSTGARGSGFRTGGVTRPVSSSCGFALGPIGGGVGAFVLLGFVLLIALLRRARGRFGRSD